MVYKGHIEGGRVVLDGQAAPPEGAEVEVIVTRPATAEPLPEVLPSEPGAAAQATDGDEADAETLALRAMLLSFAGVARGLSPDMARNHDHYFHGAPER